MDSGMLVIYAMVAVIGFLNGLWIGWVLGARRAGK